MSTRIPCPSTECDEGIVYVHNAYSADPLVPEVQVCELCQGHGFISPSDTDVALAN